MLLSMVIILKSVVSGVEVNVSKAAVGRVWYMLEWLRGSACMSISFSL